MPDKSAPEILKAYKTVYNTLAKAGLKPKLHRLDNECSQILLDFMDENDVTCQLVPSGQHRVNAAERAIRTFKNHFVAGLCSTDPAFPMFLWDELIPQACLSLNLLRASRINPKLSAYAQVFGQFAYTDTPLAPPGTHVLVHDKPNKRETWASHAIDAWYLGPSMLHHRCFRVWAWKTRSKRTTDTLTWLPKNVALPQLTPQETIQQCTSHLVTALQQLHLSNPPSESLAPNQDFHKALIQLHDTLSVHIPAPTSNSEQGTIPDSPITHDSSDDSCAPAVLRVPGSPTNQSEQRVVEVPTVLPPEPRRSKRGYHPSLKKQGFSLSAINIDTGLLTEYRQLIKSSNGHLWEWAACEEWARLAQGLPTKGIPIEAGTNTIFFIAYEDLPPGCIPTYPRFVVADKPHKANPIRVRITVGGNLIDYPFEVSTKPSDLVTVKVLINSTISTTDAQWMSIDIIDFYLNTPMVRYEYMKVLLKSIPADVISYYNLESIARDGYVYVEIRKGMYGLPQAGKLANDDLVLHLAEHGYIQSQFTPGLFTHLTRPISFCLVVDDFGVKYINRHNAEHLVETLKLKYPITTEWEGTKYLGLKLDWDYVNHTVDISMPKYISKALARFEHPKPTKPQHSPHEWTKPNYGAAQQMTPPPDDSNPLPPAQVTTLQQIIGVLLYYARAVDSSMLVALGSLASSQSSATANTMTAALRLLDYASTHPNAKVRFQRSKMILHIHSDASYLSESSARSRSGGISFLSDDSSAPSINGAIHVHSSILKNVVSSAAEAEVAALFHNAQDACTLRQTLTELGHPQPPTPLQTDNKCADGIMNRTVKQKRSKAMDMRYYWLQDRVDQKEFRVHWQPGASNQADYFTKHHAPKHHIEIRSTYFYDDSLDATSPAAPPDSDASTDSKLPPISEIPNLVPLDK